MIKKMSVEVNLYEKPFKEGETLYSYAKRIVDEDGLSAVVTRVDSRVYVVDVCTMNSPHEYVSTEETVIIECMLTNK